MFVCLLGNVKGPSWVVNAYTESPCLLSASLQFLRVALNTAPVDPSWLALVELERSATGFP